MGAGSNSDEALPVTGAVGPLSECWKCYSHAAAVPV
jgi:hypothetical protein